MDNYFLPHDIQRLESYTKNLIDFRLVLDLVTDLASLFFQGRIDGIQIDALQKAILLGMGVQGKNVDTLCIEFNMPSNQILAKFYDAVKKITKKFGEVIEGEIENEITGKKELKDGSDFVPISLSLDDELNETAAILAKKQKEELKKLKKENLLDYAIKGTEEDWAKALKENKTKMVSVKRLVVKIYYINILIQLFLNF